MTHWHTFIILKALGFHVAGITTRYERCFERARDCYNLSLALLSSSTHVFRPSILCVVVLNNIGEVYLQLCQYDAMVDVYQHLKVLWASDNGANAELHMKENERRGLLWNMLLLKKPCVASAA